MTSILVLGGGAPTIPLQAGALLALDELGVKFDALSCAGAGIAVGLLYASPNKRSFASRRDALGSFTHEMFIADSVYGKIPINYKVFLKPGPQADMYRRALKPMFEGMAALAGTPWGAPFRSPEIRDRLALMAAAASPSDLDANSKGLCAHAPWVEDFIDFDGLKRSDLEIYFNAFSLDRHKMAIFEHSAKTAAAGAYLTADHFRAALAFPMIYPPFRLKGEEYIEGSAKETLCIQGVKRHVRSAYEAGERQVNIVVFDVLSSEHIIHSPRDLYDAWIQSMMVPLFRIAEDDAKRLEHKVAKLRRLYGDKMQIDILKIDFEVPRHLWGGVMDWSQQNQTALFKIGRRAGRRFLERNRHYLTVDPALTTAAVAEPSAASTPAWPGLRQLTRAQRTLEQAQSDWRDGMDELREAFRGRATLADLQAYLGDVAQRSWLYLDVIGRVQAPTKEPPEAFALGFDHYAIQSGSALEQPVNLHLLQLRGSHGEARRPLVVLEESEGHAAGLTCQSHHRVIRDLLSGGHPVYVIAASGIDGGQSLADLRAALRCFLAIIAQRHPDQGPPSVIADMATSFHALLLSVASDPAEEWSQGPIILSASPVSPRGERSDGLHRRSTPAHAVVSGLIADTWLGSNEKFDCALLAFNRRAQEPAYHLWTKYADAFRQVDSQGEEFIRRERLWREQAWLGLDASLARSSLRRGAAREGGAEQTALDPIGDIRSIQAPLLVYLPSTSGNVVRDDLVAMLLRAYPCEGDIRNAGRRVIYCMRDKPGKGGLNSLRSVLHLASPSLPTPVDSLLATIETLPFGLYELLSTEQPDGSQMLSFEGRSLADLRELGEGLVGGVQPAVAARRSSMIGMGAKRPGLPTPGANPNNGLGWTSVDPAAPIRDLLAQVAAEVRKTRLRTAHDNPFFLGEQLSASMVGYGVELSLNLWETCLALAQPVEGRAAENAVKSTGKEAASPGLGTSAQVDPTEGGYCDAVLRMLLLLGRSRGGVRLDRFVRLFDAIAAERRFSALSRQDIGKIVNRQSIIVAGDQDRAIETLPDLLNSDAEREAALDFCRRVVGSVEAMALVTKRMFTQFESVLRPNAIAAQ